MSSAAADETFTELLSAVIERHTVASRLRPTARLAEEALTAALRIGDGVRRARRAGAGARPDEDDLRALASLATDLERATDAALRAGPALELRRASAAGRGAEASRIALSLFLGLERPLVPPERIFVGLTVRRRARSGETLVHPGALADEIARYGREGVGPESGVAAGVEEPLLPEPIAVSPSFAACGSEVALAHSARGLEDALLEDDASGDLVLFVERIAGPFSVTVAQQADDEWWAASAVSYGEYRDQLIAALAERGVGFEIAS